PPAGGVGRRRRPALHHRLPGSGGRRCVQDRLHPAGGSMPMISSRRRKALTVVAMLGGALLAQQASAACRIQSSWFTAQDVTMDISESITQQNSVARCDWSGGRSIGEYVNAAQRRPVAGFSNVYETDVAGVGIRLFRDSGAIQTYYPHSINFAGNATISLIG